jgi:hypothetical protein
MVSSAEQKRDEFSIYVSLQCQAIVGTYQGTCPTARNYPKALSYHRITSADLPLATEQLAISPEPHKIAIQNFAAESR